MDNDRAEVIAEHNMDKNTWTTHVNNEWDDETTENILIETIAKPLPQDIASVDDGGYGVDESVHGVSFVLG